MKKTKQIIIVDAENLKQISKPLRIKTIKTAAMVAIVAFISFSAVIGHMLRNVYTANKEMQNQLAAAVAAAKVNQHNLLIQKIGEANLLGSQQLPSDMKEVLDYAQACGAWYPDVIFAQACIESACATSYLAEKANNLFGMKRVGSRPTTQLNRVLKSYSAHDNVVQVGYGCYMNWQLSVIDRILWDEYVFNEKPSREQYLQKIKSIYAEDPLYIDKIEKMLSNK